jgi:glycosyltransferase involved in cell wall biosynthesis
VTTVVSLTPVPLERDSRTFKQAASMARLGYESVVVEGLPSEELARADLPFRLLSFDAVSYDAARYAPAEPATNGGRPAPRRPTRALAPLAELYGLLSGYAATWGQEMMRRTPPADLYYLHAHTQFPAVWMLSRRHGVPYVYDAHDFYSELGKGEPPGTWPERAASSLLGVMERVCVRGAAEVMTVNESIAGLMEERFRRRPLVIHNGHDPRLDRASEKDLRAVLDLPDDAFVIAVTGHAKTGAAVEEAMAALGELPDPVHLAFVGAGFEPYRVSTEASGRVHFPGAVAPDEVVPFIAGADAAAILYYPLERNFEHALPNRFFLSLAAGLPLLYPRELPEIAAVAERHELGLPIDPRSPGSIAAAVRSLFDDPEGRGRFAENARRVADEYSWERQEARLGEVVERALARKAH